MGRRPHVTQRREVSVGLKRVSSGGVKLADPRRRRTTARGSVNEETKKMGEGSMRSKKARRRSDRRKNTGRSMPRLPVETMRKTAARTYHCGLEKGWAQKCEKSECFM